MGDRRRDLFEKPRPQQAPATETELQSGPDHSRGVANARERSNRRGFGEIPARAADLPYRKAVVDRLAQHLIVEDEAIRVRLERQTFQDLPTERPIACVILGQLATD